MVILAPRAFRRRHAAALARWDEHEAPALMPEDARPRVEPPAVSREALKDLQRVLVGLVVELEELWGRRN
jgi:hypothetical protein